MKLIHIYGEIQPQPITMVNNKVLIASNIQPYETEDYSGYQYDCEVYTKDEYILKLAAENASLKQDILDTQMALVELYEAGDIE